MRTGRPRFVAEFLARLAAACGKADQSVHWTTRFEPELKEFIRSMVEDYRDRFSIAHVFDKFLSDSGSSSSASR